VSRRSLFLPVAATVLSLAILLALGTWQWQRMGEKRLLIDTIASRTALPPQPLPDFGKGEAILAYTPVTMTGRFDHAREAHVFFSLSKPVGGASGPGYLILTPFTLADGRVVLVNRGFVPEPRKLAGSRAEGQIAGETTLTGLLRLPEARGPFSGADDPAKNVYFVRDPAAIAKALGIGPVAPFTVDLKAPLPPGGLPVPGVTQIDIPNNHFQYALTWWSLAVVLAVIFLLYARQQQRGEA
jgi:surfeit locus 1 family protein